MPDPIKRHISLQPLSRQHHDGLLLCWKLKKGLQKKINIVRLKAYIDWFWSSHLKSHFEFEEKSVFPILGNENELVKKALEDHRKIRSIFQSDLFTEESTALLAEEIRQHIRFEERVLFQHIEKIASTAQLALIENLHVSVTCEDWYDPFWLD